MDRRIRKTRKLLFDQMILLMLEYPEKDITVRMLTEKADINRGTFYLHFTDMQNLIDQLKDSVYTDVENLLIEAKASYQPSNRLPMLRGVIQYAYANQTLCRALLGPWGEGEFIDRIKLSIREHLLSFREEKYQIPSPPGHIYDFFFAFVCSGIIGVLQECIRKDYKIPPDDVIRDAEAILLKDIEVFFQINIPAKIIPPPNK